MRPVETREQFEHLERVASFSAATSQNVNEVIHAYHLFIDPEAYICESCGRKRTAALSAVKAVYEKVRAEWVERNAQQDLEDYKSGD